jgi:hypothetical protein
MMLTAGCSTADVGADVMFIEIAWLRNMFSRKLLHFPPFNHGV